MGVSDSIYIVPEGTLEINEKEFYGRNDLIEVIIPPSVKMIGEEAFSDGYSDRRSAGDWEQGF